MKKEPGTYIELGVKIKTARIVQRKTLKELSEACGATPSFLSQVERGIVAPSLDSLKKISASLGVPVAEFLGPPDKLHPIPAWMKAAKAAGKKTGASYEEAVNSLEEANMSPFFITLEPSGEVIEDILRAGDDMFVLVLEGALEVWFRGAARIYSSCGEGAEISWEGKKVMLGEGDSFYSTGSGKPGRASNPLSKPARLICVTSANT